MVQLVQNSVKLDRLWGFKADLSILPPNSVSGSMRLVVVQSRSMSDSEIIGMFIAKNSVYQLQRDATKVMPVTLKQQQYQ